MCICGTVLIVAVSASLTNDSNLSHFDFKSHTYSVPLRSILPTLQCKYNILSVGNQTKGESSRKIFHSLPVLHITFKENFSSLLDIFSIAAGQLSTRTIPHRTCIGLDEWFYWLVVILVGSCPRDRGPDGQWLDFILIWWGIFPSGELSQNHSPQTLSCK